MSHDLAAHDTALDLTPGHVGRDVTLTGRGWAVSGPLYAVTTETTHLDDHHLAGDAPTRVPVRTTTTVTVGPWTATLDQPETVTVEVHT